MNLVNSNRLLAPLVAATLLSTSLVTASASAAEPANHAPSAPTDLTVGDRSRPLNVEGAPLFGWLPHDMDSNEVQSAYQIKVTRDSDSKTVWDSGKVGSSDQAYVPYQGPGLDSGASYTWTVRTWDRGDLASPWAEQAGFDTGLGDRDWDGAAWIRRATSGNDSTDDYTLARKEVATGTSPVVRARAYVASSKQYELHLNGHAVDYGQAFSYPGEGYYQAADITRYVTAGQPLAIGVIYHYWTCTCQGAAAGPSANPSGVLVRVVIDHADGSQEVVVSDGSWRVRKASQWTNATLVWRNNDAGDRVEQIDATQEPVGWDSPGYDTSASPWTSPVVVGQHPLSGPNNFTHLQGQEPRLKFTVVKPVSVKTLSDGAVVADFGTVIPAVPLIHFQSGVAGRKLTLQTSYNLTADGHASTGRTDTQGSNMSLTYVQRDGDQTLRAFTYWGWRYLQFNAPGPGESLTADDIQAVVQHTDADKPAQFHSSDQTLNAVFDLMQRSAIYGTQQQFLDTPTREKGQFLGDAADISFATMASWGERDATQKAIREFMASQIRYWPDGRLNSVYPNGDGKRDIPDYTEMFPGWVWRYYMESGDKTLLADAYQTLQNVAGYIDRYRNETTGLITNLAGGSGQYQHGIIDWPPPMRYGYDTSTAARTVVNVWAVDAYRSTAQAAQALGRPTGEVQHYRQLADDLVAAINAQLRRPDGIYIDGLSATGAQSTTASQHPNSFALAFDIAPKAERTKIADYVAGLGMRQGPMTVYRLLQGLSAVDRSDAVMELLTDAKADGWANILARGGTFTWEQWNPTASESYSHSWGAQAIVDILESLLGVTVTEPGAGALRVRPPRIGLTSSQGSVYTQRGSVAVDWGRRGRVFSLDVRVPVNSQAEVFVPATGPGVVHAHGYAPDPYGQNVRFVRMDGGYAVYQVGSGRTTFTSTSPGLPTPVRSGIEAGDLTVGEAGEVTTWFVNDAAEGQPLRDVKLSLDAPKDWTVTASSPSTFREVAAGETVRTTWSVTPAKPGQATLRAGAAYIDPAAGKEISVSRSAEVSVQASSSGDSDLVQVIQPDKLASLRSADKGTPHYVDRSDTITAIPDALTGRVLIPGANDDKRLTQPADYLQFTLKRDATVYVAFDSRGQGTWWPGWLADAGFTQTDLTIDTTDAHFVIFAKRAGAGRITLGPNSANTNTSSSYFTIIVE
ncbi:family 78 glycoside hydrolase catalytic domain [Micromonospora sp. SL1-18]|uniref:family 78 glycoside hydrolase catalytic domain n=1 Tax=Micromonospora sp. SL1-18 TaxID=3399128 RepID=UPI003A4D50AE